jgi:hypothetical protein
MRRRRNFGVESIGRGWSLITTRRSTSTHRLEAKRKGKEKHLRSQAEHDISQKKKYLHKYKAL